MKNYYSLKLPNNPLKDKDSTLLQIQGDNTNKPYIMKPKDILDQDVIDKLEASGLEIDFIVVFKTNNKPGNIERRVVHSDITWQDGWVKIPFGINWEIGSDVNAQFQWWDVPVSSEKYPVGGTHLIGDFGKLSGIHYGGRIRLGKPLDSSMIEQVGTETPLLVRTDIPHCVVYEGNDRISISVRFKQLLTWEEAVLKFKELLI